MVVVEEGGITAREPEALTELPDKVHPVLLLDDQFSVVVSPSAMEEGVALKKLTTGESTTTVILALEDPPGPVHVTV